MTPWRFAVYTTAPDMLGWRNEEPDTASTDRHDFTVFAYLNITLNLEVLRTIANWYGNSTPFGSMEAANSSTRYSLTDDSGGNHYVYLCDSEEVVTLVAQLSPHRASRYEVHRTAAWIISPLCRDGSNQVRESILGDLIGLPDEVGYTLFMFRTANYPTVFQWRVIPASENAMRRFLARLVRETGSRILRSDPPDYESYYNDEGCFLVTRGGSIQRNIDTLFIGHNGRAANTFTRHSNASITASTSAFAHYVDYYNLEDTVCLTFQSGAVHSSIQVPRNAFNYIVDDFSLVEYIAPSRGRHSRRSTPSSSIVGRVPAFTKSPRKIEFDHRRPFGVEVETIGLGHDARVRSLEAKGHKVYSQDYTHQVSRDWKVVPDSSLSRGGGELVSPPLKGKRGLAELQALIGDLKGVGVTIDHSCGLHVHHSFNLDESNFTTPSKLVQVYNYWEPQCIDYLMAPSRRRNLNNYCGSMDRLPQHMANNVDDAFEYARQYDRYYKVNLQPLTTYGTVEFRHHHGAIDPEDITDWVVFTQILLQGSYRNPTDTLGQYSKNWAGLMKWLFSGHDPGTQARTSLERLEQRYVASKTPSIRHPAQIVRVFSSPSAPTIILPWVKYDLASKPYDEREEEDEERCDDCGYVYCECNRCERCDELADDCVCDRCEHCVRLLDQRYDPDSCGCERCESCNRLIDICAEEAECDRCAECMEVADHRIHCSQNPNRPLPNQLSLRPLPGPETTDTTVVMEWTSRSTNNAQ